MVITEEIIGKETLLVPLLKITTNEEVETLEVVVVEVTLEVIEKEDTIEKIRETGPKRETGTVETEEDVAEEDIIIAVTTTTDNKVKDPKGIGRTRISHKLIFVIFLRSKKPFRRSFGHSCFNYFGNIKRL